MMKFLLLLTLPLMAGCEAEVRACATGWVQFTCKYPRSNKIYEYAEVLTHSGNTLQSSQKDVWEDKGRFSLYNHTKHRKLKVAVKHLERKDFGEYRCRFYESHSSPYKEKWTLEPAGSCQQPSTQTVHRAAKTTITCDYPDDDQVGFLCKGESFTCEDVLSTKSPLKSNRTFTLRNTYKRFIVSISDVSSQDAGVYWCGLESKDGRYRVSVGQIKLEVKEPLPTSVTHSATSSPTSTPSASPEERFGVSGSVTGVIVCVAVMVFLGASVLVYKRLSSSQSRGSVAALQHIREVQECVQQPGAETTTHFPANIATNTAASPHYATINFQSHSDKAGGEPMKPNSSACEYSAVKFSK